MCCIPSHLVRCRPIGKMIRLSIRLTKKYLKFLYLYSGWSFHAFPNGNRKKKIRISSFFFDGRNHESITRERTARCIGLHTILSLSLSIYSNTAAAAAAAVVAAGRAIYSHPSSGPVVCVCPLL